MTCGELLVQLLQELGVEVVFGIPGVHTVELYRALPSMRIKHITPRHEQGAGFMADGYARVTGKPGVCFVITGPGMTNIMTAMAQAYADSIPMLVVSSVGRTEQLGMNGGRLHELRSQRNLAAGVTAFSHTLMRPEELPAVLCRAFGVFHGARPRPVHLEIPLDVITTTANNIERKLGAIPNRPGPCPEDIGRAVAALQAAHRPVILLGGGAVDAGAEILALAEALDAPTACTANAKGLLPKMHPLSLGSYQSTGEVRELIKTSDVVLAIGTELGETDYDTLAFDGNFRIPGTLIRVDVDPEQLNCNFMADVAIISDARLAVQALLNRLEGSLRSSRHIGGAQRVADVRRQIAPTLPTAWRNHLRILQTLEDALPDLILVGDSTQPIYSGNFLYESSRPRSWFNSATGYGTLGYALPAAVGAKLGSPHRPVVALIGDGGLQFTLSELASAVEAKTGIIILVWNNHGYGEIKSYMQQRGIQPIGVDIYTPDFLTIARGFGCHADRAMSVDHLRNLVQTANRTDRPSVIEVLEGSSVVTGG